MVEVEERAAAGERGPRRSLARLEPRGGLRRALRPVAAAVSGELTFVDTNVLLYAQDLGDDRRRGIAQDLLAGLWTSATGALSTQVLQEFYDVGTHKMKLQPAVARRVVAYHAAWPVSAV
jgi:hypothetical protein